MMGLKSKKGEDNAKHNKLCMFKAILYWQSFANDSVHDT